MLHTDHVPQPRHERFTWTFSPGPHTNSLGMYIIILTLQVDTCRHRESKRPAEGHRASDKWDVNHTAVPEPPSFHHTSSRSNGAWPPRLSPSLTA